MASWLVLVAALAAVGMAEKQYFILRHMELTSMKVILKDDESPAVGKALAMRRGADGLKWYQDSGTGALRTAEGDLCVHEDKAGVLRLAECGTGDWRFYRAKGGFPSGLVYGSPGSPTMRIAIWENSGNNAKLISKPLDKFKDHFGASWVQQGVSGRSVSIDRLESLLRRLHARNLP